MEGFKCREVIINGRVFDLLEEHGDGQKNGIMSPCAAPLIQVNFAARNNSSNNNYNCDLGGGMK